MACPSRFVRLESIVLPVLGTRAQGTQELQPGTELTFTEVLNQGGIGGFVFTNSQDLSSFRFVSGRFSVSAVFVVDATNLPTAGDAAVFRGHVSSVVPATFATVAVPGGGSIKTDCIVEWIINPVPFIPPKKGLPTPKASCGDGQEACDFDVLPGQCTFKVVVCVNNEDPRLVNKRSQTTACEAVDVLQLELLSPLPDSTNAADAANAARVLNAIGALGANSVNGRHANVVAFSPAVSSTTCTELIDIVVPLKTNKAGFRDASKTVKLKSRTSQGLVDTDAVTFTCRATE
jgi:hypothetical protein